MKLIYTLVFSLILSVGFSQDYWVSAIETSFLDECYHSIKTSDGGVLAVGVEAGQATHVLKFDGAGTLEWRRSYSAAVNTLLAVGLTVVEGADAFFIAETEASSTFNGNILKIDLDGEFIERNITGSADINDLFIDEDGMLLAMYNDPFNGNISTLRKLDQEFNLIWELDLSFVAFPLFDSHAYLDDDNQLQLWASAAENQNDIIRLVIDSEGSIMIQEIYPAKQDGFSNGIIHGNLDDKKAVYVAGGGNVNGTVRTLTLVDLETKEELKELELADILFWITDLEVYKDRIYVCGQYREGNDLWSKILILDEELNIVDEINLKELVIEVINDSRGISVEEISLDESGNILATGHLLGSNSSTALPTSKGYLNMFLNRKGGLDDVSIVKFEDFTELSLSPNPCHENLLIDADLAKASSIEVYNSLGQKMVSIDEAVFPYQLNTDGLQAGQYFIMLANEEKKMTRSFIKQ